MEQFSDLEIKKFFEMAKMYFDKAYTNGITFDELKKDEEIALKKYLKFYTKNLDNGKIRYNSDCKKARYQWFILETIEKIMEMNNLQHIESIDFCFEDLENQTKLFKTNISVESYDSYIDEMER